MSERLPTFMKRKLFSELRDRVDRGQKCPSLKFITKFCGLRNEGQAENILRQMQADGLIVVIRMGPYPWVSVIRNTYSGPRVTGMQLDAERMGEFVDGNDVLVVKEIPAPTPRPRHEEDGEPLPIVHRTRAKPDREGDAAVPAVRPNLTIESPVADDEGLAAGETAPELPKAETVEQTQGVGSLRDERPDQVPEVASPVMPVAETESEPVVAPSQPVEARSPYEWAESESDEQVQVALFAVETLERLANTAYPCGHPNTPENTSTGRGYERCRTCKNKAQCERRAKRREGQPPVVPVPHFTRAGSRQLNIRPPEDLLELVIAEAKARNVPVSTIAREAFIRGMTAAPGRPLSKPRIRANVMAALRRDGRPYDQFIEDLLALGLEQYLAFRSAK